MSNLPPPPTYEVQLLAALVDPVLVLATTGTADGRACGARVEFANAAALALTGFGLWEVVGRPVEDLQVVPGPGLGALSADLAAGLASRMVVPLRRASGTAVWVELSLSPLLSPPGSPPRGVCVLRAVADADRLLLRDPLTDLATPTLLLDRIGLAIAGTGRHGGTVAVAACRTRPRRVDLGEPVTADLLLRQQATRLRQAVRPTDTAARIGGDELAVACPGLPDPAAATQIAGRLLGVLQRPVSLPGGLLEPVASVGVAVLRPGVDVPEALLARARHALVAAEAMGGSCIRLQ